MHTAYMGSVWVRIARLGARQPIRGARSCRAAARRTHFPCSTGYASQDPASHALPKPRDRDRIKNAVRRADSII